MQHGAPAVWALIGLAAGNHPLCSKLSPKHSLCGDIPPAVSEPGGEGAWRAPRPSHVLPYPPPAVVTWVGSSLGAPPAHWVKPICCLPGWEPEGWPSPGLKQQQADLMHVWRGNPQPIIFPTHQQAQQWRHCSLSGGKMYG